MHQTSAFTHDGHELAYDTYGSGDRLVVYMHGLLLDADLNRGIAEALAERGYRVVLLDLLGHGRSDRPDHASEYRIDTYADQVFGLLDHLGVERRRARRALARCQRQPVRRGPSPGAGPGPGPGDAGAGVGRAHRRAALRAAPARRPLRPSGDAGHLRPGPAPAPHPLRPAQQRAAGRGAPARGHVGHPPRRPRRPRGPHAGRAGHDHRPHARPGPPLRPHPPLRRRRQPHRPAPRRPPGPGPLPAGAAPAARPAHRGDRHLPGGGVGRPRSHPGPRAGPSRPAGPPAADDPPPEPCPPSRSARRTPPSCAPPTRPLPCRSARSASSGPDPSAVPTAGSASTTSAPTSEAACTWPPGSASASSPCRSMRHGPCGSTTTASTSPTTSSLAELAAGGGRRAACLRRRPAGPRPGPRPAPVGHLGGRRHRRRPRPRRGGAAGAPRHGGRHHAAERRVPPARRRARPHPRRAAPPWTPEPTPAPLQLLDRRAAGPATPPSGIASEAFRTVLDPRRLLGVARAALDSVTSPPTTAPALALNGRVGRRRDMVWTSLPLAGLLAVRRAQGTTLNDVVLAVTADAIRRHLGAATALDLKHTPPRVLVPVGDVAGTAGPVTATPSRSWWPTCRWAGRHRRTAWPGSTTTWTATRRRPSRPRHCRCSRWWTWCRSRCSGAWPPGSWPASRS